MELLQQILEALAGLSPAVLGAAALVLDVVLKRLPTQKPLSILHAAARGIRLVADITMATADALDKLLPIQNVKPPE